MLYTTSHFIELRKKKAKKSMKYIRFNHILFHHISVSHPKSTAYEGYNIDQVSIVKRKYVEIEMGN
jgi:hypothetical protein